MSGWRKLAIIIMSVVVGWIVALPLAGGAVWLHVLATDGPEAEASAGMYAFMDAMLFLAVFAAVAAMPPMVAVWRLDALGVRSRLRRWLGRR